MNPPPPPPRLYTIRSLYIQNKTTQFKNTTAPWRKRHLHARGGRLHGYLCGVSPPHGLRGPRAVLHRRPRREECSGEAGGAKGVREVLPGAEEQASHDGDVQLRVSFVVLMLVLVVVVVVMMILVLVLFLLLGITGSAAVMYCMYHIIRVDTNNIHISLTRGLLLTLHTQTITPHPPVRPRPFPHMVVVSFSSSVCAGMATPVCVFLSCLLHAVSLSVCNGFMFRLFFFLDFFISLLFCFSLLLLQPVVLHDGVLTADGAVGSVRGVCGVVGPVGRQHVRRFLDGGILAAVRLVGARLPPPPGLSSFFCVRAFCLFA